MSHGLMILGTRVARACHNRRAKPHPRMSNNQGRARADHAIPRPLEFIRYPLFL